MLQAAIRLRDAGMNETQRGAREPFHPLRHLMLHSGQGAFPSCRPETILPVQTSARAFKERISDTSRRPGDTSVRRQPRRSSGRLGKGLTGGNVGRRVPFAQKSQLFQCLCRLTIRLGRHRTDGNNKFG